MKQILYGVQSTENNPEEPDGLLFEARQWASGFLIRNATQRSQPGLGSGKPYIPSLFLLFHSISHFPFTLHPLNDVMPSDTSAIFKAAYAARKLQQLKEQREAQGLPSKGATSQIDAQPASSVKHLDKGKKKDKTSTQKASGTPSSKAQGKRSTVPHCTPSVSEEEPKPEFVSGPSTSSKSKGKGKVVDSSLSGLFVAASEAVSFLYLY
jgi:hypothetical protein